MIKILTDSTADLAPEQLEAYHISVIPLSVTIDRNWRADNDA